MEAIYSGNYANASKIIESGKLKKQKRNTLLYLLNKGTSLFMANQFEQSNEYFRQADYFIEDYQKNYAQKAVSFLTNPSIQTYEGESFEKTMLHYYTVLNYLQANRLDEAMVECKRMNLKLQKNIDYFKGKNKYKNDAFVHLLTGLVYDAQKDYNNAFIAYKNAFNIYKDEYAVNLNTPIPEQLKLDLIRTALQTGFIQEAEDFKTEFKLQSYNPDLKNTNYLVAFWNNGFGPVKDQWSINFSIIPAGDGWVNFTNWDLGLNFPFYVGKDDKPVLGLKVIRVAFPKYVSRKLSIKNAQISFDSLNISSNLHLAQNIDKIAYISLQDRMIKELGEALLRLAIKQVTAAQVRKENDLMGSALSIVNAISEQADTRNWQTLPNNISYTRIALPVGNINGKFTTSKGVTPFNSIIQKDKTKFNVFQSPYFNGYSEPIGALTE